MATNVCDQIIDEKFIIARVETFDQYLNVLRKNKLDFQSDPPILFRGQNKNWPLYASLARLWCAGKFKNYNYKKTEKSMFDEFKCGANGWIAGELSDWDWLALAQHYKLPTKLLDWSEDPFVALWFALWESKEENSVVWVFQPKRRWFLLPNVDRSLLSPFSSGKAEFWVVRRDRPCPFFRTIAFKPNYNIYNIRLRRQFGCFVLHEYISDENGFISLNEHKTFNKGLKSIEINTNSGSRLEILNELNKYGINEKTMFYKFDFDEHLEELTKKIRNKYSEDSKN
ncbi:MAG: FRG domain-containing protein [Burkholderiaceae bacterium]|jgi:hypothetical protein|nr:FRG domain-containing protein [Burkholderiaceae bacterium]